ncbi:MAG: hypothetical protein LBB82_01720, partial [Treponema sp.]|nr:hypothetical protein [Treponema sp.]
LIAHFEKAPPAVVKAVMAAQSKDFYALPEQAKREHYALHTVITAGRYDGFNPVVFYKNENGALAVCPVRDAEKDEYLNPFSAEGRAAIAGAANTGVEYNRYRKESLLEDIAETVPGMKALVEQAMERAEEREQAERFGTAFTRRAVTETGGPERHVKSRVHVVRSRSR